MEHILALLAEMDLRYQQRFDAQKEGVASALTAAEKAVHKAESAAEKRFESVNEFRGQLTDQAATFLTRTEYVSAHQAIAEKISDLAARVDKQEGSTTGGRDVWAWLFAAAGIVVAIVVAIIK